MNHTKAKPAPNRAPEKPARRCRCCLRLIDHRRGCNCYPLMCDCGRCELHCRCDE